MPDWNEVAQLPLEEQIPIYCDYLKDNPENAAIWSDLGLRWNLGIAATAIHDWALARHAWRGFGIGEIAEGADARYRWGDIVLHDGAPSRKINN